NDLHELLLSQFTGDRAKDASAARIAFFVDDHDRIGVKAKIGTIVAPDGLLGPDHHRIHHLALFYRAVWSRLFNVGLNHVAHTGILLVAADDSDGGGAFGPRIVGHV